MPAAGLKIIRDEWTPLLNKLPETIQRVAKEELDTIGTQAEDLAKSIVVVRTGYLRSAIFHALDGLQLTLGATADYAPPIEYGTRYMAARPFLRPAFDAYSQRLLDAIVQGVLGSLR